MLRTKQNLWQHWFSLNHINNLAQFDLSQNSASFLTPSWKQETYFFRFHIAASGHIYGMFSAKLSAFHYLLLQQPCIYCEKVTQKLMNLMLIQAALLQWDRNFHETLQGSSCKVFWICSKKRIVSKSWSKSVSFSQATGSINISAKTWGLSSQWHYF